MNCKEIPYVTINEKEWKTKTQKIIIMKSLVQVKQLASAQIHRKWVSTIKKETTNGLARVIKVVAGKNPTWFFRGYPVVSYKRPTPSPLNVFNLSQLQILFRLLLQEICKQVNNRDHTSGENFWLSHASNHPRRKLHFVATHQGASMTFVDEHIFASSCFAYLNEEWLCT